MISEEHSKKWPPGVRDAVYSAGNDLQHGMVFEIDRQWLKTATIELKKCCTVYYPTDEEMLEWFAGSLNAWVEAKGTYPQTSPSARSSNRAWMSSCRS